MFTAARIANLLRPRLPVTVEFQPADTHASELMLRAALLLGRLISRDVGWREQDGTLVVLTVRPSELDELRALRAAFEESLHERITAPAPRRRHAEPASD